MHYMRHPTFSHFDMIQKCDRHTHTHTHTHTDRHTNIRRRHIPRSIASHGNNGFNLTARLFPCTTCILKQMRLLIMGTIKTQERFERKSSHWSKFTTLCVYRARQLYKNISMLFLFPVKTVSIVQASIHNVSKITLQNIMHK